MTVTVIRDDLGEMPAEFETLDEAIAEAMRQLAGAGVVVVHGPDCEHDGQDDDTCTCTPLELALGAES